MRRHHSFGVTTGQGLVEVILATALILLVVYAMLNLASLGLLNARLLSDRTTAQQVLQEGEEILRAKRNAPNGWATIQNAPTGTVLCIDPATNAISSNCVVNGQFNQSYLVSGRFERTFELAEVKRSLTGSQCPVGCPSCGTITTAGGATVDTCTRRLTVQVAWPGVGQSCSDHPVLGILTKRYCIRSWTYLTRWRN